MIYRELSSYEIQKRNNQLHSEHMHELIASGKYQKVMDYAFKHWQDLCYYANRAVFKEPVSIADQLCELCKCSYALASDVANSVSLTKAIMRT